MSHWHDSMVDRPETDGAVYVTGWTISGLAVLGVILVVWGLGFGCLRFNPGLLEQVGMLTPSGRVTCKRGTRNAIAAAPIRTMPRLFIITGLSAVCPKPHPVPARASV